MKYLKTYNKLFESSNEDLVRMVEDLLRDFSDNDVVVEVDILDKFDMDTGDFVEGMFDLVISIDKSSSSLSPLENIQSIISMNEYIVDEGWSLDDIELFYPEYADRSIDVEIHSNNRCKYETKEFNKLIEKIKSIGSFTSLDFCYSKAKVE